MVVDWRPDMGDRMEGRALWCELWMDPSGDISLTRGHGCTRADAMELCRLASAGDLAVSDRTDDRTVGPEHPSFSWLRSGT